MYRTVLILIVSWLCIFSVSEASLGASCNKTADASNCTSTNETCIEDSCRCSSGYSNVNNKCILNSISVTIQANSSSIVYGSSVILTATITSEVPVDKVKWQREVSDIDITPDKYTQSDVVSGKVTLTITNIIPQDGGSYRVQVNNSAGIISDWSTPVTLVVTGEKPSVVISETVTQTEYSTVTIHCTATVQPGSPAITAIQWLLNGNNKDISDTSKYSGGNVNTPSLTIKKLGSTDAGEYHCRATNLVGSTTSSQSVTLAPPSDVRISATQPVNPIYNGSSITFTGYFTSKLHTENKWQKLIGADFTDIDITDGRYTGSSLAASSPKLVITKVDFIDRTSFRFMVTNRLGFTSSESITLNVVDGSISVTLTTPSTSVKYGVNVILRAEIESPASVNSIKWQKVSGGSVADLNINLDKYTQTGSGSGIVTLTINNVDFTDSGNYQVQVSNIAGTTKTSNQVSLNVKALEFNDNCTNTESCNSSENLECSKNKCLCVSEYYHKEQVCHPKSRLAPTITDLTSTTSSISVFWSPPNIDLELVTEYEVNWKVNGINIEQTSGRLNKSVNSHTVSSGLMSGQLYIVKVISHGILTNPAESIVVTSNDSLVRLDPLSPGPILNESNFAHTGLRISWTAPNNTFVTRYEVTIESDDATYHTSSNSITLAQFNGKSFTPGAYYYVMIATVSGETLVKKSPERAEWIRIIPTQPGPPTNVRCPDSPLDVSLHITWEAPTNSNGIIQSYMIDVSPRMPSIINTTSNITNEIVGGLQPEKTYTFTVRTVNDADESIRISDPSQSVSCKTRAGVSSPPTSLVLDEVKSREFMIKFVKPDDVSGVLAGYKILILQGQECIQQILVFETPLCDLCVNTTSGCTNLINQNVTNITMPVSYTATGLNPYTNYFVRVTAINGVGEGHPVNATTMTDQEVPKQPGQINASNIYSKNLTLSWNLTKPSPGDTTYTIYVENATDDKGTNFTFQQSIKVHGFEKQSVLVDGLEEYWQYRFKVDASTVKGNATSNISSTFRTKQAAPGQVVGLTVQRKGTDYRTAYVSWRLPALIDHNGVLKSYLFSNNHTGEMKTEEINVSLIHQSVEERFPVVPENIYAVTVILINTENMESVASSQVYQASPGPPDVSNIEPIATKPGEHIQTQNTITLEINVEYFRNDLNGIQVLFGIAVCAESNCKDTRDNDWENLPTWREAKEKEFPLYRATNDSYMEKVRKGDPRQKRSTTGNSSLSEYKIGEDSACPQLDRKVHCNGPLDPGIQYMVIIFACTHGGCTNSDPMGPYATTKIPEEPDSKLAIIIGACAAVVVFLVIVGVVVVIFRRRNRLGETKKYTKGLDNQMTIDEPVAKNIPRKRPIKLKELSDKVAEKHKDSNLHFAREYEDLKALSPKHPAETSELDNNKLKNRYVNILPFDHSRVKLMLTEDDDPSTDFINANYLPGYKSQREYIATQGPIPGTIDDFWRMIWEQNVSIIVMLTLCKEEGRVKCEMYWPENIHEPKQYGDLVVETVSNSTVNFYEFRIFKIKLGDTTRSVKHFHFLQWKDFSANVQNDVMIDFIKNVRNHIRPPDMNGPVVVHCSAGVGRTGTYCALDHLFQFVDEHDLDESIDIFDLVMNLRERRMFMVQTEQQYVFIHDCVRDYVERKKKELQGNLLYENVNRGFVADEDPMEESLYQNYSNQRTDL